MQSLRPFAFLAFLCALATVHAQQWTACGDVPGATGNLYLQSRWRPDTGLKLRLVREGQAGEGILVLDRRQGQFTVTPEALVTPAVAAGGRFHLDALPAEAQDSIEVALKFRDDLWAVYVGNRLVAELPPPFPPPLRVMQSAANAPPADAAEPFFQKTEDFTFTDDFLVPEGEENVLSAWPLSRTPSSANWCSLAASRSSRSAARTSTASKARAARG